MEASGSSFRVCSWHWPWSWTVASRLRPTGALFTHAAPEWYRLPFLQGQVWDSRQLPLPLQSGTSPLRLGRPVLGEEGARGLFATWSLSRAFCLARLRLEARCPPSSY